MATKITNPFISLNDIINNFIISYTGPGKLIPDSKRTEVVFHARRCLQEFSYETLKSQFSLTVGLETTIDLENPEGLATTIDLENTGDNSTETLQDPGYSIKPIVIPLPKDLVTIVGVFGSKRVLGDLQPSEELTEVASPLEEPGSTQKNIYTRDYKKNEISLPSMFDPGQIYLTYLSNSLTTSEDAAIPKLAEEAMYACMVYAILANRENTNPNLLQRLLIEKIDKLERSKSRLVFTNFSE